MALVGVTFALRFDSSEDQPLIGSSVATTTTSLAREELPQAAPSTTVPSPPASPLAASLAQAWSPIQRGCLVVSSGGRTLFESNPREALAPASVVKVLTTIAAVDLLGDHARFRTTVRSARPTSDGTLVGDLWVVGGGDPVLGTRTWAEAARTTETYTSLEELADRVVAANVRVIEGRVLGDESRYDDRRTVESWPNRLLDDGEVGPLSALTVNDGFRVYGHPGVPFEQPAAGAAEVFAELLEARGVSTAGTGAGRVPDGLVELTSVGSPTVRQLITKMLVDSDNGIAELLVKELGATSSQPGSREWSGRELARWPAVGDTGLRPLGFPRAAAIGCRS